jgi:hypothetical protein
MTSDFITLTERKNVTAALETLFFLNTWFVFVPFTSMIFLHIVTKFVFLLLGFGHCLPCHTVYLVKRLISFLRKICFPVTKNIVFSMPDRVIRAQQALFISPMNCTALQKSPWNHSLPWKYFHVPRINFHCMEGAQKFHAPMEIIT